MEETTIRLNAVMTGEIALNSTSIQIVQLLILCSFEMEIAIANTTRKHVDGMVETASNSMKSIRIVQLIFLFGLEMDIAMQVNTTNTEACGWDGGDCIISIQEKYPDCILDDYSKIGNGRCDGETYNTTECGYDGGDCLV